MKFKFALVILLVATALGTAVAGAQQTQPSVDNSVISIELKENGNAEWSIRYRSHLDSEEENATFQNFKDSFEENPDMYFDPFKDRIGEMVSNGNSAVERDTYVTDFESDVRTQYTPQRWGVVEYTFTWVNFAEQTEAGLSVGDIFPSGLYISDSEVLLIYPPEGYSVDSTAPQTGKQGDAYRWSGPLDFQNGRPTLVMTETPTTTTPTTETTTIPDDEFSIGSNELPIIGILAFLLFLLATIGADRVFRNGSTSPSTNGEAPDSGEGEETEDTTDKPDDELLSRGERVRQYLRTQNMNRAKQSEVSEEFGWSSSRASQILKKLEDDGEIKRIRSGRTKVVCLPDSDN